MASQYKAVIPLQYQPGTLKAVSLDADGNEVKESILRTSGMPAAIRLTPDRIQIHANGQDLAYVTLEVTDAKGNVVSDADIQLTVSVYGKASLLAAASANLKDIEPKTSANVTTYKGRAIIVVKSGMNAGKATIKASSANQAISGTTAVSVIAQR